MNGSHAMSGSPDRGLWRDPFLIGALAVALAYRLLLLATIDSHAHYDEALIGVMARHILERGERPLYFYGQNYGGGGALEAYAAAFLFSIFGESAALLKAFPLVCSLLAIPLTFSVAARISGRLGARLAVLFFLAAPPNLEWSLAARGGYVETQLFSILLVALALPALCGERVRARRWFLAGAVGGFAFYVFGLIAPTLIALGILCAAARPGIRRALLPVLGGFAVGAAPLIYDNVAHGYVNLRHLLTPASAGGAAGLVRLGRNLARFVAHDLPAFFSPWIDDFVPRIPPDAWAAAIATFLLAAAAAVRSRSDWRRWLNRALRPADNAAPGPALAPLLFVVVYLVVYSGSRFAGQTPRYLFGLYPLLAVLAASGAAGLVAGPSRPGRVAGALLAALLAVVGIGRAALLPRPSQLREYKVVSSGESVPALLDLLRREKIDVIFATPPIKWKVLWEGRGEVLAATLFFPQEDWYRYSSFENEALGRAAYDHRPAAIVTHARFAYESFLPSMVLPSLLASRAVWEGALAQRRIAYRCEPVGDYLVYHGFSANVPALLRARELTTEARRLLEGGQRGQAQLCLDRAKALDPADPEIDRLLFEARANNAWR